MKSIFKAIFYVSNLGNLLKAKSVFTTACEFWKVYVGVEVKLIA